jgi:hypothetical protein
LNSGYEFCGGAVEIFTAELEKLNPGLVFRSVENMLEAIVKDI